MPVPLTARVRAPASVLKVTVPARDPVALGVKTTDQGAKAPAAMVALPPGKATSALSRAAAETLSVVLPLLVNFTVCAAEAVSLRCGLKVMVAAESAAWASRPLPLSETVLLPASVKKVSVAASVVPGTAVGAKVTVQV